MKIIKPGFEFITPIDGGIILKRLEECGRVCYKSEGKITDDSAPKFVAGIIKRGHEAVLEHCSFTVKFICDRGVSHEIVRHRMASYCQESTRYCNYGKDQFGSEITVVEPCYLNENTFAYDEWKEACRRAETAYFNLLNWGLSPQEARAVLPNSLKTEVVMTANIREWRHFLRLRTSTELVNQDEAPFVTALHHDFHIGQVRRVGTQIIFNRLLITNIDKDATEYTGMTTFVQGNQHAALQHILQQTDCFQTDGLTSGIRSGYNKDTLFLIELYIQWYNFLSMFG